MTNIEFGSGVLGLVLAFILLNIINFFSFQKRNPISCQRRGGGQPHLYPSQKNIDPAIFPLVAAVNESGKAKTQASCGGHVDLREVYVAFTGEIDFMCDLDHALYVHRDKLKLPWYLAASFDDRRALVFCFRVNHEAVWSDFRWYNLFGVLRRYDFDRDFSKTIRTDIECLVMIVKEAA